MAEKYSFVYMTAKDREEAKRIALHLIEEKLAACANMFPVSSVYTWKGKVIEDDEVGIIMKTRASLVERLIAETKKMHSYEVPCVVSIDIEKGFPPFIEWIGESTKK